MGVSHPGLDDPLINHVVFRTLQSLNHLLIEARNIDSRYALQDTRPVLTRRTRALDLFRDSFEEFKEATQQNQKQKSVKTVTRWAIHDADKFEGVVKQLRVIIDGLQDITKLLGVGPDQQARLKEEIESVADVESLRLIRDAAGQEDVSDVASQQLQHFDFQSVAGAITTSNGMDAYSAERPFSALPSLTARTISTFGPDDFPGNRTKSNVENVDTATVRSSTSHEILAARPRDVSQRPKGNRPNACATCRKKKIRCDFKRPCKRCVLSGQEVC